MSQTSNVCPERFANRAPNHRTVTEIQKKVVEQGDRSVVSRFLHAKSDQDAIAGWKQDLLLILQVFNGRPPHPVLTVANSFRFRLSCQSITMWHFWIFAGTCRQLEEAPTTEINQ